VNQQPRAIKVMVAILSSSDLPGSQATLARMFATGTEGLLVINDGGTQKYVSAVSTGIQPYGLGQAMFGATLVAADPRWRAVLPTSSAGTLTATGQSFIFTNPGQSPIDDAVINIRSVAQKAAASAWLYGAEVILVNRAERPLINYAIEVTGGGWDHATEVGASRSQADGDDVRVLTDAVEVPRWFGENAANDPNSAATKVWANFDFGPRRTAILLNAITVASPSLDEDLVVSPGGTLGFPRSGALLIDNEVILYQGRTESNADGNAAFTGVTRGARGTTVATHSASTTIYWVEHRVQLIWGNTGVAAPASRPDLKPLLDLTSSTVSNSQHEWLNFLDDTYPARSMQWGRRIRPQDDQFDKILSPGGSPASIITFEYQSAGAVAGKPAFNTWYRDFPTGTGSSGGNVASVTRVLADTLGMWIYGIDNDGADVVLQKLAGALSSASLNVTAPTNPVYRIECWAFNQVVAQTPRVTYASLEALTATPTDNGQRVTVSTEPVDVVGVIAGLWDGTGGATVTCSIIAENGSNAPAGTTTLGTATYTTVVGTPQYAAFAFATPVTLLPGIQYWFCFDDGAGATTSWQNHRALQYTRSKRGGVTTNGGFETFDLRAVLARPGAAATSFVRFDGNALADDSDQVTVDGVTVYLSSTDTPYVSLKARANLYRTAPATLYNEATGQSIALNYAAPVGHELRIDLAAGSVTDLDDENGTNIINAVTFSDPDDRLTLVPGANSLRWMETGIVQSNVSVDAYAAWE
jgi:hypothetical protein